MCVFVCVGLFDCAWILICRTLYNRVDLSAYACSFPPASRNQLWGTAPQIRGDGFSRKFRPSFLRLRLPRIIGQPELYKNNMHIYIYIYIYVSARVIEHAREHVVVWRRRVHFTSASRNLLSSHLLMNRAVCKPHARICPARDCAHV